MTDSPKGGFIRCHTRKAHEAPRTPHQRASRARIATVMGTHGQGDPRAEPHSRDG
jgi:hypothetical protein